MEHIIVRGLRPDLILSDFQLPMGLTGDQIVAEISAFLEFKPPTIILTGDLAEQHVVKARVVADHLLPKPVDINALLFQMETLIRASACDRKELQQAGIL
jgi:two-component system CheB/CheR fusion protein